MSFALPFALATVAAQVPLPAQPQQHGAAVSARATVVILRIGESDGNDVTDPTIWEQVKEIGINGVWLAYPITFVSMLVLQASYYQFVWRKKKIVRLV